MSWDGVEKRTQEMRTVQAVCIQRTADALAEGHHMAEQLEMKLLNAKAEQAEQTNQLNMHLAHLEKDLALLAQNVAALARTVETLHTEIDEVRALAISSERRIKTMEDWQIALTKRQAQEDQDKRDSVQPWREVLWRTIQAAVIFVLGIIVTALYEKYLK